MNYRAEVIRVIDGDTLEAIMYSEPFFGVQLTSVQKLRLARIDSPEVRGPEKKYGLEAEKALMEMMDLVKESGTMLRVSSNETDDFGRYIAEIWFSLKEENLMTNVSDWMVSTGHAEYRDY